MVKLQHSIATTVILFLKVTLASAQDQSIKNPDLLWKARGLQAMERIELLSKKNGKSKGKNLTQKENCQWQLEALFLSFANPSLTNIVRKPAGTGLTNYILVFFDESKEQKIALQLGYVYENGKDTPIGLKVPQIEIGKGDVFIFHHLPGHAFIRTGGCIFDFPVNDPFSSKADPM